MLGLVKDIFAATRLPRVRIDLMRREASRNDPFYLRLVEDFFRSSTGPHPKYRIIPACTVGIAMCDLLSDVRPYLTRIEASGQRNVKKAQRLGYRFGPLDYNAHVHEVVNIRRSNDERQGRVSLLCRACSLKPVMNPAPLNDYHRYDYYGVFREGALHAYAACFQAGQVCLIEQVFGHADDLADGVVPMLLAGIAQHLTQFPHVQYYCYGTTFGAPTSMRRFKKKFLFYPHNVIWELG